MICEAQAEYLAYLRRAGETRDVEGGFAVRTGAASNTENGVVAHGPVEDVAALVDWFAKTPASWLDLGGANYDALVAAGAHPERNGREMRARIDALALGAPDDVRVEPAAVGDWLDFAAAHDWFEDERERAPFERLYERLAGDRFRLHVARVGDEVAGFASSFRGGGFVLLTQVVVDERFRRRGVATALLAERLRGAHGVALLGPSPDGAKLYAALGFELRRTPPDRWYYLPCR